MQSYLQRKAQEEQAPWMKVAHSYLGLREVLTDGTLNPTVREFFRATRYPMDQVNVVTPWCSSFGCAVVSQVGIVSPRSARARDWLSWGIGLSRPIYGSMLVFIRGDASKMQGHFGFCDATPAEGSSVIDCLGGNQANSVCVRSKPRAELLGIRWPAHWPVPPEALL